LVQANVDEYVGGKDAEIEGVMKTFQETSSLVNRSSLIEELGDYSLDTSTENIDIWNCHCSNVGKPY